MTPRERVLAVLRGQSTDKVPFTIYGNKLPQCAAERRLRNEGMCLVERRIPAHTVETPNCVTESHTYTDSGRPRVRTVTRTPVGEVSTVLEPAGFTSWTVERLFRGPEDYKVLSCMVEDRQLLVRRGDATVEVLPHEVRRLVDALVERAAGLVDQKAQGL